MIEDGKRKRKKQEQEQKEVNDKWSVNYKKDEIYVENKLSTAKLYVNDKVQDVYYGMVIAGNLRLYGKTSDGKEVKVVMGGDFKLHCSIFVDCDCLLED